MKRNPGRPKGPTKECQVTGCKKTAKSKGMCPTHYMAFRRGRLNEEGAVLRPLMRVRRYDLTATCVVVECKSPPSGRGLCNAHYLQHRAGTLSMSLPTSGYGPKGKVATCVVVECHKQSVSRGMCRRHSEQRKAGILDSNGLQLRELQGNMGVRRTETWEGKTSGGYTLVLAPSNHPSVRADGTILEHRLVLERQMGRYLKEWEIVRHKDGDRSNNDISNLQLLDGRAKKGEGHPPGSDMCHLTAIQVLAQDDETPGHLKKSLRKLQRQLCR